MKKYIVGMVISLLMLGSSMVLAETTEETLYETNSFAYWGDVTDDLEVSLIDADLILKAALGIESVDHKYQGYFENGDPQLGDAQKVLRVALGIEQDQLVTLGEYVSVDIQREYICKNLAENKEDGISNGAYVMESIGTREMVLQRLANSLGEKSTVYKELKMYLESGTLLTDTWDPQTPKGLLIPVLVVADMEFYFDLGVNVHSNGFDWFNTSEDDGYAIGTVGPYGCFTAREEIRCAFKDETLEISFAKATSEKDKMIGEENAKLYVSVILLPKYVLEEASVEVYRQNNQAKYDVLENKYSNLNIEKEYICKNLCAVEGEGLSTGAYVVENSSYKDSLLTRLQSSLGKESTTYFELERFLNEKTGSNVQSNPKGEVPILLVAEMALYFDLGVEMYGSGFDWHAIGEQVVGAVGPNGYFTARNDIACKFSTEYHMGKTITICFEENEDMHNPLVGDENENLYLAVVMLPREIVEEYFLQVDRQLNFAGQDILLPEQDLKAVYLEVFYDLNLGSTMEYLVLDTESLLYLTEEEKKDIILALERKYKVEVYEASTVQELRDLGLVTGDDKYSWSIDGYWLDVESVKLVNDVLYVYGGVGSGSLAGQGFCWRMEWSGLRWEIDYKTNTWIS